MPSELPEWKKHITGGSKGSFGKKTSLSLLEQRQSLPVYKLKDELIKAGIYILQKNRNYAKTKIQNEETLPKFSKNQKLSQSLRTTLIAMYKSLP